MYVKLGNWVTGEYRQIISGFIISWLPLFLLQLFGLVHLPRSCSELTLKESILDIRQDSLDVNFQPDSDDIVDFGILSWCSLVGEYHCFRGTYYLPWSFLIGYVTLEDEATIWSQNIGRLAPSDSEISQRNGELNSCSGSQEILRFLWKPKIRYRIIIVAQLPLSSCTTLIHFTILPLLGLSGGFIYSGLPTETPCAYLSFPIRVACPAQFSSISSP